MRPSGFESPLVHLLGLVYDACCLLAFVVLLGRRLWCMLAGCARQPGKLASCLPNVAQFNPGKLTHLPELNSGELTFHEREL